MRLQEKQHLHKLLLLPFVLPLQQQIDQELLQIRWDIYPRSLMVPNTTVLLTKCTTVLLTKCADNYTTLNHTLQALFNQPQPTSPNP